MATKQNMFSLGGWMGRPAYYETPEDLRKKCEEYFTWCIDNKEAITITGLVLFLGFVHRQSLRDQEDRGADFSDVIKRARCVVERSYEVDLRTFKYGGAVFALKNMGWFDNTQLDLTTKGQSMNSPLEKLSNLPPEDLAIMQALLKKAKMVSDEKPPETSQSESVSPADGQS